MTEHTPTVVAILGSTGSIGRQTLEIVDRHPQRLRVHALAGRQVELLRQQAARYRPRVVCVATPAAGAAHDITEGFPPDVEVLVGPEHLVSLAADRSVDRVVVATVGAAGLAATLAAADAGRTILLANKEVLVAAGEVVTARVRAGGARLYPIDSEHSALWQCLAGERPQDVAKLILTASGGALRHRPAAELAKVTPQEALAHPTWQMGRKVTVDSATLMNKGMEVIEARWLFDIGYQRIEVVLHPQSIVHSLVEFCDGSLKAQLGMPDMRLPIQLALSYPGRWPAPALHRSVADLPDLSFGQPDLSRYPCLDLALQAGRLGGTYPATLAGADEQAVELFLAGAVPFTAIAELVQGALDAHTDTGASTLEAIEEADALARRRVMSLASTLSR